MCTTAPRFAYGLIANAGIRCASTWSAPSCESSSITRISESFQIGDFEISSTVSPSAQSFSAIIAFGVRRPGVVPAVWSFA